MLPSKPSLEAVAVVADLQNVGAIKLPDLASLLSGAVILKPSTPYGQTAYSQSSFLFGRLSYDALCR